MIECNDCKEEFKTVTDYRHHRKLDCESSRSPGCSPAKRVDKQTAKDIATSFFFWWWNEKGTNTLQGFDRWWDEVYSKKHFLEDESR